VIEHHCNRSNDYLDVGDKESNTMSTGCSSSPERKKSIATEESTSEEERTGGGAVNKVKIRDKMVLVGNYFSPTVEC
jgi:hypothetical protein